MSLLKNSCVKFKKFLRISIKPTFNSSSKYVFLFSRTRGTVMETLSFSWESISSNFMWTVWYSYRFEWKSIQWIVSDHTFHLQEELPGATFDSEHTPHSQGENVPQQLLCGGPLQQVQPWASTDSLVAGRETRHGVLRWGIDRRPPQEASQNGWRQIRIIRSWGKFRKDTLGLKSFVLQPKQNKYT